MSNDGRYMPLSLASFRVFRNDSGRKSRGQVGIGDDFGLYLLHLDLESFWKVSQPLSMFPLSKQLQGQGQKKRGYALGRSRIAI